MRKFSKISEYEKVVEGVHTSRENNRERDLMIIALTGCSKEIYSVLEEEIAKKVEFTYDSREDMENLLEETLNDVELENLFLKVFNERKIV